ncbi:MAG: RDD family protein [Dehalococcoidia bacterium]|nr:RDD family protein [Dehalococcoidia bacterium]
MGTESIERPERPSNPEYAGFWIRTLAFLIDVLLLSIISWGIINVLYFLGLWTWRGQTLGQMATNVQVVRVDGKPVDLRTSLLRYLGYIVNFLTLGIGFFIVAFDSRKQGLHDKIAQTYVVHVRS